MVIDTKTKNFKDLTPEQIEKENHPYIKIDTFNINHKIILDLMQQPLNYLINSKNPPVESICVFGEVLYKHFPSEIVQVTRKKYGLFEKKIKEYREMRNAPEKIDLMFLTSGGNEATQIIYPKDDIIKSTVNSDWPNKHHDSAELVKTTDSKGWLNQNDIVDILYKGMKMEVHHCPSEVFVKKANEKQEPFINIAEYGIPIIGQEKFKKTTEQIRDFERKPLHKFEWTFSEKYNEILQIGKLEGILTTNSTLIKADLHNHLATLENIGNNFNAVIDRARETLGEYGIVGIINAQDKGVGRFETLAGLKEGYDREHFSNFLYVLEKKIYVIKGQEVFTGKDKPEGHLLVLGLDEGVRIKDRKPIEYSLKEARDFGGIIIADHPFFADGIFAMHNPKKYLEYLDGIEVHNGEAWLPIPGYIGANKKAQEFYREIKDDYNIGAISSSDGHSIREIGSSYTRLEQLDFSSSTNFRESLRNLIRNHKDFTLDKQTNSIFPTLNHAGKVAFMRLNDKVTGRRDVN